jgi:hypothetical protein
MTRRPRDDFVMLRRPLHAIGEGLGPQARLVLVLLIGEADHTTGQVSAGYRGLANLWGMNEQHLRRRYLQELEKAGVVQIDTERKGMPAVITVKVYGDHVVQSAKRGASKGASKSASISDAPTGTKREHTSTPQHSVPSVHSLAQPRTAFAASVEEQRAQQSQQPRSFTEEDRRRALNAVDEYMQRNP